MLCSEVESMGVSESTGLNKHEQYSGGCSTGWNPWLKVKVDSATSSSSGFSTGVFAPLLWGGNHLGASSRLIRKRMGSNSTP